MNINSKAKLNNNYEMPYLGLGVWKMQEGKETYDAVSYALGIGYRHIDTAQYYGNETSVGKAVRDSGIPREDIFVTSKLAVSNFGYDQALKTFDESLARFGFDYIDSFILHFPVEKLRLESYKALENLYKDGKIKAIGVSNFTIKHLEELKQNCEVPPAVNQVEFSLFLYQKELHEYCRTENIQLVAYSPLSKGRFLDDTSLVGVALKYNKTPAQIMIRWLLQHEIVTIPKSSNPLRIKENADIFDFEIVDQDMEILDNLNRNERLSWNPEDQKQVEIFSNEVVRKFAKLKGKVF